MRSTTQISKKRSGTSKKATATADSLRHLAFDNGAQANIIFTVDNGKIIMANEAACKLLGYSKKKLLTKSTKGIFDIKESGFKKMLKQGRDAGHSTAMLTAIKKSGRLAPCQISFAVFMDDNGIANAITTITDMSQSILAQKNIDVKKEKVVAHNIVLAKSKQKNIDTKKKKIVALNIALAKSKQKNVDAKKEKIVAENIIRALEKSDKEKLDQEIATRGKLLIKYEENFRLILNSSPDVLYDIDLLSNKVILSDAYEKEFGYKLTGNTTSMEDWFSHIYPDDKEALMQDFYHILSTKDIEWKYSFRFLRANNSIANMVTRGIILRNANGEAYRRIGYMQDISKQKMLEEKLEQEIRLKEIQIAQAAEYAKDTERSDLGKELHDNINQLLGASRLYLEMAKRGGDQSEMYLSRSSEYTLTAIEEIRKLTKGLTTDIIKNLGLSDAISNVTRDTMEVNPIKISYVPESFVEHSVTDKFKLNIFRIVQEQLNNILKHAKATEVSINLLQDKRSIILSISDNGIGFDTGIKRKGIGVANINSRAASYNGTACFASKPGQGCILTATFPITDMLLSKN